ncbi:NADPH:quinone oxidoreductase family protein [Xenophilus arseniciresistens]|uniref:NADPH:quinone oxidoreductase family protein n=1 Tax=Xenophilus arseniciresistens TaxID=1283306 RepID=A0AAE3T074_9BURK|nr:NADPH:quinone oxidoreductase family protein [Xenophilus arseniciresistens]MDA7416017.1 NADPH:quinone oxidoreductase family protein [Xenophilus arseniciresistens]
MKAVLCRQYGPPASLVCEEVAPLQPGPGQVVVTVHAAAANFPDTLIIENRYQFKPTLPFSPGGEVAGVVKAVGEGVQGFAPGERVIAVCGWGGFADEVACEAGKLIRLPEGIAMEAAAALVITYGTTHYALRRRAQLQPGQTLLVLGAAGGTGLSAVELGKLMGAQVIAAASSDEKLALCRSYGADHVINYAQEDLRAGIARITNGRGVDIVYDPVGGAFTEAAVRSLAWEGRLLVIGFTAGEIPRLPLNLPLLKGASVVGVFYGGFTQRSPQEADVLMQELLGWLREGRIRPHVTQRLALEQAAQALQALAERRALGKIVLSTAAGRAAAQQGAAA